MQIGQTIGLVGMVEGEKRVYGACDVEIDFKQRVIEPPPESRKKIAETYYMQKTYGLKISKKQQKLFNAWIKDKS
jgi:deoxyribonuclease-1